MINPDDRRLLVEGPSDLHFIAHLWKKQIGADADKSFAIFKQDGKDNLIRKLADPGNTIWLRKSITHLGIVIDADESAASTLQSVSNALKRAGYAGFPTTLEPAGLIREINDLKIGVWVMPNNADSGMAEDLFLSYLPDELKAQRVFAEQTLDRLEAENLNRYNPERRRSKAQTHTVLSWQEEPGASMGMAIRDNYVTLPTEKLPFVGWIEQLFS